MKIELEGVLTLANDELVAVVYNDVAKRSQVFYSTKKMGLDEVKALLEGLTKGELTKNE